MYLKVEHLRTLQALRETGSLQAAAEQLHLTQSALSHQIKSLESHFDVKLFVRKTKPVVFTRAGQSLLALADSTVPAFRAVEAELLKLADGDAGRLNIAIECHSCFAWLMPTLETYQERWPDIEVDLTMGYSFDAKAALLNGDLDAVVTADPDDSPLLAYHPLFEYEAVLLLHRDHPLLDKVGAGGAVSAEHFRDLTLITYPVDTSQLDIFRKVLDPARVKPRAMRTTELTIMMIQWVVSQRGVCVLPEWALLEYRHKKVLRTLKIGEAGLHNRLYIATRREDAGKPFMRDFIDSARSLSQKLFDTVKVFQR